MITLDKVSLKFKNQLVLNQVSCTINNGEMLAITGPSGAGKSSFLRIIAGLQSIDSGQITNSFKRVGFIFQDYQLFPHLTVYQNISLAPSFSKTENPEHLRKKAETLMNQFSITQLQDKYPDQLSGGEKQRAAIVRTLMMDPELLLVDEATSALDETRANDFMQHLVSLNEKGMTIVFVSHDLELTRRYGKRKLEIVSSA